MTCATPPMLAGHAAPLLPQAGTLDVAFLPRPGPAAAGPPGHDQLTKMAVARHLAEVLEGRFLGALDLSALDLGLLDPTTPPSAGALLVVPADTLLTTDLPALQLAGPTPLVFGGVVPHAFVATKVITHPLVQPQARAPAGWNPAFAEAVQAVVLAGYSVFDAADAVTATARLLAEGSVRAKLPSGVGGAGQQVLHTLDELQALLDRLPPQALHNEGLVLERNLHDVTTYSVGQVRIGPWLASYCGTQQLTTNHAGHAVYGGSRLTVVRGDHDRLLAQPLDQAQHRAVMQALVYHEQALACFPGLAATRSNYDVVQGRDDAGRAHGGVLEQSWRMGGASGAEVAALQAFRDDAQLDVVEAETCEVYGEPGELPPGARLLYDGVDPRVGRLVKYAFATRYGHA